MLRSKNSNFNKGCGLINSIEVPKRYIAPDGRLESVNSYNTFVNYYLTVEPTPTAKKLADLSGFTVNTCRTWITKNNYKARKSEVEQRTINRDIDFKKDILNLFEQQLQLNIKCNGAFIDKLSVEQVKYSSNPHNVNMDLLAVDDPSFKELRALNRDNNKHILASLEAVKLYNSIELEATDETTVKQMINEVQERYDKFRFENNLKAIQEAYKETENDPF